MEIVIGVQFAPRELRIKVDGDAGGAQKLIDDAFSSEGKLLWLTDTDGRQIGVPVDKLAYIELDPKSAASRVGFAAATS